MKWISIDELFNHIPPETSQYKAVLCIAGTAWIVYGAITVYYNNPVEVTYAESIDDCLVLTNYIPTHFILIPNMPNFQEGYKLVHQKVKDEDNSL